MRTISSGRKVRQPLVGVRQQRGQSLAESAIACLVVIPLFIGVYLLGQYMHVRQSTQQSARAAAWDAAVTNEPYASNGAMPSKDTAETRMRALQFGKATTKINGVSAPGTLSDPMLTTFAGRDLVVANKVVLRTYTNGKSPALSEKALGAISKITSGIGLGQFPPDPDGLLTAEVHVTPEHITGNGTLGFVAPLDTLDLDFHGRTVLLADAWNAQGSGENINGSEASGAPARSVRLAMKPLVISEFGGSTAQKLIDTPMHLLGKIPFVNQIWTNNMDNMEIGKTAPDVVPADRLATYGKSK